MRLDVVRSIYESFAVGDFSTSLRHFDPSFVLVIDEPLPDAGAHVGRQGLRAYMDGFLEPWEKLTITATSLEQAGDTVLAECTQAGTGIESGAATELRYYQLWTFRGDALIHLEVTNDRERARSAAGL